jgi:uncharacterized protein YggU (UPF0235/DUF167 family)
MPDRTPSPSGRRAGAHPDRPVALPSYASAHAGGCVLTVRVIPRAGRTDLAGERAGALLVRLAAAPVEGAANDALLACLSERLDVARARLTLTAGARGRDKRIHVAGLGPAEVVERLGGPGR